MMKLNIAQDELSASRSSKKSEILWGWKRDSGGQQRAIVFGGMLDIRSDRSVWLDDWFLFYRSRSDSESITCITELLERASTQFGIVKHQRCSRTRLDVVEFSAGPALFARQHLIKRLLNRRPRPRIPLGSFPTPTQQRFCLDDLGPAAVYVGSGLSYESGLPTLASVHEIFGVDRIGDDDFTFGARDPIPPALAADMVAALGRFVSFHILAAGAMPSRSHHRIAELLRSGRITRILTDNVDDLFARLDVPFTQTRGMGLFNDRFSIRFDRSEMTLLVIGVAADRRGIIHQARSQGLKVVVVNPEERVSPRSQSLSYVRRRDLWYRTTASNFLSNILQ